MKLNSLKTTEHFKGNSKLCTCLIFIFTHAVIEVYYFILNKTETGSPSTEIRQNINLKNGEFIHVIRTLKFTKFRVFDRGPCNAITFISDEDP